MSIMDPGWVKCSRCGGRNERAPAQRYCHNCHAARMRVYRAERTVQLAQALTFLLKMATEVSNHKR